MYCALQLSLKVNNLKKKKKVLVPSLTFSATAAAILYNDLIPIFVDINQHDLNMSFKDLKKKYSKDCVAVIAVHFGGHPCEMDKIVPWAKKKGMVVIEDCAHTCGGTFKNKKLGNWGDFSCFSFEDKKVITTGDGGMLCLNNKKLYSKLKSLSFHGWDTDPWSRHKNNKVKGNWYYEINKLGYKYNMNNLMASIGIEQLKKLNFLNKKRIRILNRYIKSLSKIKQIQFAWPFHLKNSCYWLLSLKVKDRNHFMSYLRKKGIASGVHLMPLPLHPLYRKYNSNVENVISTWKDLVSLPFFPDIKNKEVDYVIRCTREYFKN